MGLRHPLLRISPDLGVSLIRISPDLRDTCTAPLYTCLYLVGSQCVYVSVFVYENVNVYVHVYVYVHVHVYVYVMYM